MTCEQAMELLSPWLDGELSPELREALEAHLETCPNCKALADTLRGLDETVAGLREPAPQGLKQGVLYKIDQATGKAKKSKFRWFGPGTALGAVAAVLVLLVGLGVIPIMGRSTAPAAEYADMDYSYPETAALSFDSPAPDSVKDGDEQGIWYSGGKKGQHTISNQSGGAEFPADTISPAEENFEPDTIEQDSRNLDANADGPDATEAISGTFVDACAALSAEEDAMVLVYTEFDCKSLFELLKAEEPALFALVEKLEPEERDEMLVFETDCGTALAIHEWLLARLPKSPIMSADTAEAETSLRTRMEELDPGSGSLYKVITWSRADAAVSWPGSWPEGWADRVRTEENWGLFFPEESYTPNAGKVAYLAFVP